MKQTRKIKPGLKFVLIALVAVGVFFLAKTYIFPKQFKQSQTLSAVALPDAPKMADGKAVAQLPFPGEAPSSSNAKPLTMEIMAWNSQMGLLLANGGASTTEGSIMESNNVRVNITRQDDCEQMKADLVKFANDYASGEANPGGTSMVGIMGDGAGQFLADVNDKLATIGDGQYKAKIFFSCGKSQGEDKLMGPQAWKDNPQSARGGVTSAYIRDGDWNIVVKWCADNGIPVNPDETTYDPTAMNFIAAKDFIDASQKYISGYEEERPVVVTKDGKTTKTGETKKIKVQGVATWTPGDVLVAENKGGLVSIVSTAEYRSQMPNVVIGIDKFLQDNRPSVEGFIKSVCTAGDQIKTYDEALKKAGDISDKVYGENKGGAYWVKYYKGVKQSDTQGLLVDLGGSRVHNLADNLNLFGLNPGTSNVYASVYKVFGDIVVKLYPELYPTYPKIEEVLDLSYLNAVRSSAGSSITTADVVKFDKTSDLTSTTSKRAWKIEFTTGSAELTSEGEATVNDLFDQLIVASGLKVEILGYTDNTGSDAINIPLSQSRANAIKSYLQRKSPAAFPDNRFVKVQGLGSQNAIGDNNTAAGREKNRRVEIIQGQ